MKKPKTVVVDYIESGAFQGGEEDVSIAGIKRNEECLVIKRRHFDAMWKLIKSYQSNEQ